MSARSAKLFKVGGVYFASASAGFILICLFNGITVLCWNSLDALGVELFPTEVISWLPKKSMFHLDCEEPSDNLNETIYITL